MMTFTEIKTSAKGALKGRRKSAVGAWLLYFLIAFAIGLIISIGSLLFIENLALYNVVNNGTTWLSYFVIIPLAVGLTWLHLDIYDQKAVKAKDVFKGFSPYWKVMGAYLLVGLYTVLWSLLLIVTGIIKAFAYSQTLRVLKDNPELSISEAITKSRRLMDGNKWRYFLFQLSFILWQLPVIVTYSVGVVLFINAAFNVNASDAAFVGPAVLFGFSLLYSIFLFFYFVPYYFTADSGFYRQLETPAKTD